MCNFKFVQKPLMALFLLCLFPLGALAQSVIKGTVNDEAGGPIIGATVKVQGSQKGAITDLDGKFSVEAASNATITISYVGYVTQNVKVAGKSNLTIVLKEDNTTLNDVVVIGYGVQRKSDLTGSVASVKADDIKNLSTADAAAALQGKVSGVNVLTNGSPGSGADIRVRGYSSNSENISPLYIVDGLQVKSIQYLDPQLIESIEILKDAASAAIYGAEAGNGVVLVTTKKGDEGRVSVNYTGRATLQNFTRRPLMNRKDFLKYIAYEYGQEDVDKRLKDFDYSHPYYDGGVIDQDWISAYIEPTWSQQHTVSVSGGNTKGHFFTSLNYVHQNGVVKGDKDVYKRITGQVNADYNIYKWLQVGSNNSIEKWETKSVSQRAYGSSFEQMIQMDPLTPVYWTKPDEMSLSVRTVYDALQNGTADQNYRLFRDEKGWFANTKYSDMEGSPLAKRDATDGTNGGWNINGTLFANLMPIKGLTITSRLGYRINYNVEHSYTAPFWIGDRGNQTTYSISTNTYTGWYYQWENFANYNITLAKKHNIGAMIGMSYRESNSDDSRISSSGADILQSYEPNFRYISYLKDDAPKTVSNAPSKSASVAYFGRLTYNYDSRYFFQFNIRRDAYDSSKLSKANRWGTFPSVSAGWTISNEKFFAEAVSTDVVSFLKLRASWGTNGNISVLRNYPYTAAIAKGSSWYQYNVDQIGSVYGSHPDKLANPSLTWETLKQVDLGLDARFLGNRLSFTAAYYDKRTKDLLFSVSVPSELGFTSVVTNGGTVLNRGLELELGWRDRINDFAYSISGNLTTIKNKVLSLAEGATPTYKTDASSTNYKIRTAFEEGHSIWYLNGFVYEGLDADGNPKYKDLNGDGEIGTDDMTDIGRTTPSFTYGINITAAWKGFDLMINGYGQGGNKILPVLHRTGYKNGLKYYLDEARTPENPGGSIPHPEKIYSPDEPFWSSTGNLFSGNFFRIKQLQLGYTIPANITKKAAISNLRLYVSLDDFFTITSYPGLDPETASTNNFSGAGLDWGSYPTMKKLILGVNVTF
ncbi:TonB-linked outer membrane protein, SusC/RagA family [Xylanibacter ruminicola]|uniref:TonB-linked outer membrane protein, SusC/RagA family n=2 Tax=Xylanibacter ruminicola TaxID=839 RepID=A0A1H5TKV0_XYLRU|nr:TonB-linked outer membrane protein, SusC/RagA family [Xylanibacter ruminicola]